MTAFFAKSLLLFFAVQSVFAEEHESCQARTNNQIESCHKLSTSSESACLSKLVDTTNKEALALVMKHSAESQLESTQALVILKGSEHKDALAKYKTEAELCKTELANYKSECNNLKEEVQTCEDLDGITDNDASSLNRDLFQKTLLKNSTAQEKLSEITKKIELIENEIEVTKVNLCKQKYTLNKNEDCDNMSPELAKKIDLAFTSCSKENSSYQKNECFRSVKPSLNGNYNQAVRTSPEVSTATERSMASLSENKLAADTKPQVVASGTVSPAVLQSIAKVDKLTSYKAEKKEAAIPATAPLTSASKEENSNFKMPSISTILDYAVVGTLIYGAVTGKLKTWINKLYNALVPESQSGGRGPSTSGGASGTTAASIKGVVNPPSLAERIAMRDRNRANGDGDGGGSDGGIYMQGAFDIRTDANGIVTSSNVIIHGTSGFTAVGRVTRSGTSTLNLKESGIHDVGLLELIVNNGKVSGKMRHGGGKEWIYGDVVGTYSP